ncbi:MAG: NAD-binding protein [Chthoniobacterales bacterium]
MKFVATLVTYAVHNRAGRRNLTQLARFLGILLGLVTAYSIIFHLIMDSEGQHFTWVTGFYWTLTVMSTLGFGDITFTSDLGRMFSIIVLLSGMIFLLVLLPFTFIEFFYAPWMKLQESKRAPRELPASLTGHVLLSHFDPVTEALVPRLKQFGFPYALIVPDIEDALRLHDERVHVVVGDLDDPDTYRRCGVERAALVAATSTDPVNTNVAFTVRELSATVPILTTANSAESVDVLQLAGSTNVLQLGEMMGQSLARRIIGGDALSHVIGTFDDLLIAEATAAGTPLVGKPIADCKLRENLGVTIAGIWERGTFVPPKPTTTIQENTVLILAGSREQFQKYDELFCIYHVSEAPVVIIGGGRSGRATGAALKRRGADYRIIETLPERIRDTEHYVHGDAASLEVLTRAGIMEAPAVVITPHEDDVNTYLTIYCRRLRPDIQIITRATFERNISTMHRAGADFVMSYASMGANSILNVLKNSDILMLAEGLDVFRVAVPPGLAGKTLADSGIRERTNCSVITIADAEGNHVNPTPDVVLADDAHIVLIGNVESEKKFLETFQIGAAN